MCDSFHRAGNYIYSLALLPVLLHFCSVSSQIKPAMASEVIFQCNSASLKEEQPLSETQSMATHYQMTY